MLTAAWEAPVAFARHAVSDAWDVIAGAVPPQMETLALRYRHTAGDGPGAGACGNGRGRAGIAEGVGRGRGAGAMLGGREQLTGVG